MTGVVYDEVMTRHVNAEKPDHVEGPHRISVPQQILQSSGIFDKCINIPSRYATDDELLLVHTAEYINQVKGYRSKTKGPEFSLPEKWLSYVSDHTYQSASCAVGCSLQMVDAVMSEEVKNGIAIVRPPGHHAEEDETCGFCFFNNLSIAAKYAQKKHGAKKVLIVDWDIHHGNGIQHVFYKDSSVLYVSLHRYDCGEYFPGLKEGNIEYPGEAKGEGFNVNIPWNKDMMGNSDYKAAFDTIVLPIANQFKPDLILVACGFDAVAADPLGDYILTPEMFAYMTQKLMFLAEGKMILCLEGGYSGKAIGQCFSACLDVLLGNKTPIELDVSLPCKRAMQTINSVVQFQSKYWNLSRFKADIK